MLQIIALLAIMVIALLLFTMTRPATFRVERSTDIQTTPEKIFPFINDFHQWKQWSPWEHIDPLLKRTYGGAAAGKGTRYAWEGNNKVGSGQMEILESAEPSRILIQLDFLKPFAARNAAEFILTEQDGNTTVTWAMYGANSFMAKVMSLFVSMDRMIGAQFEQGLANLKQVAERD